MTLLVGLVGFSARAQEHNLTIINDGGGYLCLYDNDDDWVGQYYDSTVVTMTDQLYHVQAITFTPSCEWLDDAGVTENSMQVTHFYVDDVEVPLAQGNNMDLYNWLNYGDLIYLYHISNDADHKVRVVYGPYTTIPGCLPVSNLMVEDNGNSCFVATWNAWSTVQGYNVSWTPVNYNQEPIGDAVVHNLGATATGDSYAPAGGTAGTHYLVTVQALCDESTSSIASTYVDGATFYTLTIVNNSNGDIRFGDSVIHGTAQFPVREGEYQNVYMYSYSPEYSGYSTIDATSAQLKKLYDNGVVNNASQMNIYTTGVETGMYYQRYNFYSSVDHTIEAVFGPYLEGGCPTLRSFSIGAAQEGADALRVSWVPRDGTWTNVQNIKVYALLRQYDNTTGEYIYDTVTTTTVAGDATSALLTGLQVNSRYRILMRINCTEYDYNEVTVISNCYIRRMYKVTMINDGGGYMDYGSNNRVADTVTVSIYDNDYFYVNMKTLDASLQEAYGIQANAAQLTHLYLNGQEVTPGDWGNNVAGWNLGKNYYEGEMTYSLSRYGYSEDSITVRAVYGPYGSLCLSPYNVGYQLRTDTSLTFRWTNVISDSVQLTLEQWDDNNNRAVGTPITVSVRDTNSYTFTGLQPYTNYRLGAVAVCDCGNSDGAYCFARTKASPMDVTFINIGGGEFSVSIDGNELVPIQDTMVLTVPSEAYLRMVGTTYTPVYPTEQLPVSVNAAQYKRLFIDNQEYTPSDMYWEEYGYVGDELSYYRATYNRYMYSNETIRVVRAAFGPYSDPCASIDDVNVSYVNDSTITVEWELYDEGVRPQSMTIFAMSEQWNEITGGYEYDTTTVTVAGTANSATITGLKTGYYNIVVRSECGEYDYNTYSMGYWLNRHVAITILNHDHGYMRYNDGYDGRSVIVEDSVSVLSTAGYYGSRLTMYTISSESEMYGVVCDSAAAQLLHLYVDGVEVPFDRSHIEIEDYMADDHFIAYTYSFNTEEAHTIRAEYGPYGSGCLPPTGLTVDSITTTSALLSWTASGSTPGGYSVTVENTNGSYDAPQLYTTTGTSVRITGLQAGHYYRATVRSNCGAGDGAEMVASFRAEPILHHITVMKEGSGVYTYGDNYSQFNSDSNVFTVEESIYEYEDYSQFIFYTSNQFNYYDYNTGDSYNFSFQLMHLYIDGVEVPLVESDMLNIEIESPGHVVYYLSVGRNADHVVRVVYGEYGSACMPTYCRLNGSTENTATFQWTSNSGTTPAGYVLKVYDNEMGTGTPITVSVSGDSTGATVGGLQSYTRYWAMLGTVCGEGDTVFGANIRFRTLGVQTTQTVVNEGGGLMRVYVESYGDDGFYYELDSIVSDSAVFNVRQGGYISFSCYTVNVETADPAMAAYVDSSNARFVSMSMDNVIMTNGDVDNYMERRGFIRYYLYGDVNANHSYRAVFAPYDESEICLPVSYIDASEFTDTSLTIYWYRSASNPDSYTAKVTRMALDEYGSPAGLTDDVISVTTSDTVATFNGLLPNTFYALQIISNCSESSTAAYSTMFSTAMAPHTVNATNNGGYVMAYADGETMRVDSTFSWSTRYGAEDSIRFVAVSFIDGAAAEAFGIDEGHFKLKFVVLDGQQVALNEHISSQDAERITYTFTVGLGANHTISFTFGTNDVVNYTVTVLSDNEEMGTVTGGRTVVEGTEVTIEAIPAEGYRFVRWNDNVTDNPRTVVVVADVTYTAYFEAIPIPPVGIDDVEIDNVTYSVVNGKIIVSGAEEMTLSVYDMMGRCVAEQKAGKHAPVCPQQQGVYLVKVGTLPAVKVVVIR